MSTQTTLHFFCGKMAAGKSTLARELAERHDAVLLSEDQWLGQLYSKEITNIPGYVKYSQRLRKLLAGHIRSLLDHGVCVVLDFPANTMDQRNWFRDIYEKSNASHILHYIDVSDDICKHQLRERSKDTQDGEAFTSEEEFDAITKYFQAPSGKEGFKIVKYVK